MKQAPSGQKLPEHDTHRKHIGAPIQGKLLDLLGSTGFEAGLDVRNSPDTMVDVTNSICFGNLLYPVTDPADGDGFDEYAWFTDPLLKNSLLDPGIPDCFNADAPNFGPTGDVVTNAATPPNDGFFDTTATYIGAFSGPADMWAQSGSWAVWSAN